MRSLRAALVGGGCAVALSACSLLPGSGGDDTGSPTGSGTSATSSGDASSGSGDDVGTVTGPGRPMDEGGLRAALPSAGDVGDGWVDDEQMTISEAVAWVCAAPNSPRSSRTATTASGKEQSTTVAGTRNSRVGGRLPVSVLSQSWTSCARPWPSAPMWSCWTI